MSASLPFGVSARGASILVVDDEPDVADLFRADATQPYVMWPGTKYEHLMLPVGAQK